LSIYGTQIYFALVKKMERPKSYEIPILDIDKAIKVTKVYVMELEKLNSEGLSDKQAEVLAKFAQELIFWNRK
jgi:hypothetical protein